MSYKSELQNNNIDLQSILNTVNSLPDVGGGSAADPVIEPLTITENGTYTALAGVDGYSPVVVEIPEAVQATPSITVSSSGLISASATQEAGLVEAGTKNATKQLTTQGATTITPSTEEQTAVSAGTYVTGDVKVAAVSGSGGDTTFEDNVLTGDLAGEYTNNRITELRYYALAYCQITKATFGNLTSLGLSAFYACPELVEVNLPNFASRLPNNLFYNCGKLETINAPLVTTIQSGTFYGCTSLRKFDLPKVTGLGANAFNGCSSLTTLILRRTTLVPLTNVNILTGTPIANGTGYVYVPASLVDTYRNATNWTTYANQIRALENFTVDGTITGALDESKI